MGDIEFQEYVDGLINNSIMSCDDELEKQDIEKCRKCLQNVGFDKDRKVICAKVNCKNI